MTNAEILRIAQAQLAIDLNCALDDLNGAKDQIVFVQARDNPGRRAFPRGEQHFDMLSMGKAIVVSATPDILDIAWPALAGKSRDEAFSMPFVYGHALCYLPDISSVRPMAPPAGFAYELVEQEDIPALYSHRGFESAMQYDSNDPRPDILAITAKADGQIAGMAGSSGDCANMWQVGMDVLPAYRGHGLAAYLVSGLTIEILNRGYVPYYCCSISNIASQRVARRAGYYPAWICSYKGNFDGYETLPTN